MAKGYKVLFTLLIILAGLLAVSSGFFYAKNRNLENILSDESVKTDDTPKTETTGLNSTTPATEPKTATTTPPTATTAPVVTGNKPSGPTDTVVVGMGETLFQIGQKVGVSWVVIAEANGIDADKIQAGQTLIVPKNNQVAFSVNTDKANAIQQSVTQGKDPFRLSPSETAKSDALKIYGIAASDTFTQVKVDLTAGTAEISCLHTDKTYTISLTQPVTKGEKGIWAISSIKPQ